MWFLVLFSLSFAFVVDVTLSMSSAFFETISIPVSLIGVIAFVGSMLLAAGSKSSGKVESFLGTKKLFLLLAITGFATILCEALMIKYWGLLFYLMFMFVAGVKSILVIHQAQDQVSQKYRATMISTMNLFAGLGSFVAYLLVGYVIRTYSFKSSYLLLAGLMLIGLIFAGLYFSRNNKKIKFN